MSGVPCRVCEPSRDSIVKEHRARTHSLAPPGFLKPDTLRQTVKERNETPFEIHEAAAQIPHQSHPVCSNDPATEEHTSEVTNLLADTGKRLNEDNSESEVLNSRVITPAVLLASESSSASTTSNDKQQTPVVSLVTQVDLQKNAQSAWASWVTQIVNEIEHANVEKSQEEIPQLEALKGNSDPKGGVQ